MSALPAVTIDAIQKLEHEHVHLNRVVESLRESIEAALRGEREVAELRDEFVEFVGLVEEEIFEHFEEEEGTLFPWVIEQLPDTANTIATLEVSHDRICGTAGRMSWLLTQGEATFESSFDQFVALFARFDANFTKHAREERELLRSLHARLNADQRRQLTELLRQL